MTLVRELRSLLRTCAAALLLAALALAPGPAAAGDVVRIGIFPRKPAPETRAAFDPIARRLAAATGKKFELRLFPDFAAFWEAVKRGEFDLVHYSQYHYLKAHQELGHRVILVSEEGGSATMSAALAVRSDSGLAAVADLRGRKILFAGNKQAMQGYIGPMLLLRQAGLQPGDYQEAFAVNPPNALIGVFNQAADAAAIGDKLLEHASTKRRVEVSQLKLLAKGPPLPGLAWAVTRELDPELAKIIAKTMVELRDDAAGRELLAGAEVTGFVPATDHDFDVVRKVVKDALGEQF